MAGGVGVVIGGVTLSSSRVSEIRIQRGRQDELEKTQTGTCAISLTYPTGSSSVPDFIGEEGQVFLDNPFGGSFVIFTGTVEDVTYDLANSQVVTRVEVTLVDALDFFAGIELTPGLHGVVPLPAGVDEGNIFYEDAIVGELAGVGRIQQLVLESDYSGPHDIFSGNVQVFERVYAPRTSMLTAIDEACDAEFPGVANRFVERDGTFVFHGRLARFNPSDPQYRIETYAVGDKAACLASPPRARITALRLGNSKQRIINAALATPQGINDNKIEGQIVTDSASITEFGTRSWSAENLQTKYDELNDLYANAATKQFAQYYVDNYSQPQIRIEELQLKSRKPEWTDAEATWELLCNAEISDLIDVQVTNPGVAIAAEYFVEGVRYLVRPLNGDYAYVELNLDLSPRAYWEDGF